MIKLNDLVRWPIYDGGREYERGMVIDFNGSYCIIQYGPWGDTFLCDPNKLEVILP